jgi:hypothetical protein
VIKLTFRKHMLFLSMNDRFVQAGEFTDPDEQDERGFSEMFYSPLKEDKAEVRVTPSSALPAGPQPYTLDVERRRLSKKPLLQVKGQLTNEDRQDGIIGKRYPLQLVKGRLYVAEMSVGAKSAVVNPGFVREVEPRDWDRFLTDSGKGGRPARCVFRPKYDGKYSARADLAFPAKLTDEPCSFSLTVYQEATD